MEIQVLYFSKEPIEALEDRLSNKDCYETNSTLPPGIWFSKAAEWRDWCLQQGTLCGSHTYWAVLRERDGILFLNSSFKMNLFMTRYYSRTLKAIDWSRVQREFKGVVFDNYHELRMGFIGGTFVRTDWYWELQTSCAVVWDVGVVREWSLLEKPIIE